MLYVKLHENLKILGTNMIKTRKLWGFTNLLGKFQKLSPSCVLHHDFSTEKYSSEAIFAVCKIAWKLEKDGYKYDKNAKTLRIYQFIRKVSKIIAILRFASRFQYWKIKFLGPFLMYVKLHENLKRMGTNMIKTRKLWGFTNLLGKFQHLSPSCVLHQDFSTEKYSFWVHFWCT